MVGCGGRGRAVEGDGRLRRAAEGFEGRGRVVEGGIYSV